MTGLIAHALLSVSGRRAPDFIIGGHDSPYLRRWWLIPRNPIFNIYLHQFLRDDDDRALHDHPWFNVSWILEGEYIEHSVRQVCSGMWSVKTEKHRKAGGVVFRSPWKAHRITLIDAAPCWTLFITGPRMREWGFHCPQGWRHWKKFVSSSDAGLKGPGCD